MQEGSIQDQGSDTEPKVQRDARIPFSTQLRFESDDGRSTVKGSTADVSMSGAFLSTTEPPEPGLEGVEGVVFVEMVKDGQTFEVSFHCKVARSSPRGLGLNFDIEEDE